MDYFKFVVKKEDQSFVSIVKVVNNEVTGANVQLYSSLISDEQTARANFTLTGHLPSEVFEEMILEAKS